jgi:PAS domain S-box-containing protein
MHPHPADSESAISSSNVQSEWSSAQFWPSGFLACRASSIREFKLASSFQSTHFPGVSYAPPASVAAIRVLLIEDNPGDVFLLREMVNDDPSQRCRVVAQTDRVSSGIELLQQGEADVVLLDLTLPDCQGLESFERLHAAVPHIPVVVLSGTDDEEFAAQAVHLGAQEYLVKGRIDTHLIHRALRYAIERSRSESELAQERDLLHTLLENIPDRIYFKDEQSRFIRINRALQELFHLARPEQAYGKTDADFYGAEHSAEALADEAQVMDTRMPIFNKVEFETLQDGSRSWSLTTKLPLQDRRGRVVGTCGISREITQIKEMEEQLATERNLLRSLIDNLPDIIFLKDAQGRYLLDNVAHLRWIGASDASEVVGRTVYDFFPDDVADAFHAADLAVIASRCPMLNQEERSLDRAGRERWLLTSKIPWFGEGDAILGLVCISRDITEQKLSQQHLKQANADLAASREELLKTVKRLRDAHQELRDVQLQLIEAEKMKSIGRLAAGVAHEVKNPLAVIKMGVEFLSAQELTDETSSLILKEMAEAVDRADGVIGGLLDFSAPKRLQVEREDLNTIIDQALKLVRGELKGAYEIVRELQPNLPPLALDAAKISQVFINLLTNAIHSMGQGGVLTVRTYSKQLTGVGANVGGSRSESFRIGGQIVVAEIDDTGCGIPEDKLSKVFEPFFTTKPTGQGTGLGLSVVRTIVDLHGATIDLRNLPECGTRACLMFQV